MKITYNELLLGSEFDSSRLSSWLRGCCSCVLAAACASERTSECV